MNSRVFISTASCNGTFPYSSQAAAVLTIRANRLPTLARVPNLGGHSNGERTEENVPEAGLAALCPAAIGTVIALVVTALIVPTAIA